MPRCSVVVLARMSDVLVRCAGSGKVSCPCFKKLRRHSLANKASTQIAVLCARINTSFATFFTVTVRTNSCALRRQAASKCRYPPQSGSLHDKRSLFAVFSARSRTLVHLRLRVRFVNMFITFSFMWSITRGAMIAV